MSLTKQFYLAIICFALSLTSLQSQSVRSEDDKEPSRIGYGVNLGNIRFFNHSFEFGLSPNVAYRVTESLAFGFMLKADYYYEKYPFDNVKFSGFDFGPTVFGRVKPLWSWDAATPFLQGIFLQAEYEKGFLKRAFEYADGRPVLDPNGELMIDNFQEDFLYVGLGISSGYPFSTNVSLHYNVLDDFDSARLPWSYRLGFTYNY